MAEQVNHPAHYQQFSVEAIEMIRRIYGDETTAMWCEITALKYRVRMGAKENNSVMQDYEKSKWYLEKAKELRGE